MKACILTIVDLSRLSMTMAYTDYFNENGIDYDIIYYDKFRENNGGDKHLIPLYIPGKEHTSSLKKTYQFWKQRHAVKKLLQNGNYDLIVVWNEVTAFIFGKMLRDSFPKMYTINVRDYFYLDKPFIRAELKKTIDKSIFTTISSYKYKEYLPPNEYVFLHSLNWGILANLEKPTSKAINRPIRIEYIGQIGWLDNTFRFVDTLGNDNRFQLLFIGTGAEKVKEYVEEKGYNNIIIRGKFPSEKTAEYLKEADIIYNLYGYGNIHLDAALSIKLYYAIYLGIPILTYSGTCTDEVAHKCGIGYTIHGIEDIHDGLGKLYDWYQTYDLQEAQKKCEAYINDEIKSSNSIFYEKLKKYEGEHDR